MAKKHIYISLFLMVFYATPLAIQQLVGLDVSPLALLLKLPLFLGLGLISLWFINKKTNNNFLNTVQTIDTNWLKMISSSFLLLSILYLSKSIGGVTYAAWFDGSHNQNEIVESLTFITSKPYLAIILVGPFVWLNVLFIEVSRAYFHSYIHSISTSIWLRTISILLIPLVLSSMQIDDSPTKFISLYITNIILSLAYIQLKDLKPIVIASILYQSIDLIAFWIYS